MDKIVIEGGRRLCGIIEPQGSKNAVLPIIFATLVINGISEIENVPDISDVNVALDIISGFGAKIQRNGSTLVVDTRKLSYSRPSDAHVSAIRASSYLIGSCLSRFGKAEIMGFGGCNFDCRPIDLHILAAETLGAVSDGNLLTAKKLKGANIRFCKASVGASINAIIMATAADGITQIFGAAREPHVYALMNFLRSAGADIRESECCITVNGTTLSDAKCRVIPDMIEVGTYLLLGPLTDGSVTVDADCTGELDSFFEALQRSGVELKSGKFAELCGSARQEINIKTDAYPGYPTDLQPQAVPLMARCCGGSIVEQVWNGRFGYLENLSNFGVRYKRAGNYAEIFPSQLHSCTTYAPDLRGGAACLMCALACEGKSEIYRPDTILRGYSSLKEKLSALGAAIRYSG